MVLISRRFGFGIRSKERRATTTNDSNEQPLAPHEAQAGGAGERAVPLRVPRLHEAVREHGRRAEARAQDAHARSATGCARSMNVPSCASNTHVRHPHIVPHHAPCNCTASSGSPTHPSLGRLGAVPFKAPVCLTVCLCVDCVCTLLMHARPLELRPAAVAASPGCS